MEFYTPDTLYFADFETFTPESEFFKKNAKYKEDGTLDFEKCKTAMYIYSLVKLPIYYNRQQKQYMFNKQLANYDKQVKIGNNIKDMLYTIAYDTKKSRIRKRNTLYFHNGMNFDNFFILDWMKQQDFKYVNSEDLKELKGKLDGINFFTSNMITGFFNLTIYLWIPQAKAHSRIRILDTRKLIAGSVESISKEYANKIYKDRIIKDFGNIDLEKKGTGKDLKKWMLYITDMDLNNWFTIDGEKINFKILKTLNIHGMNDKLPNNFKLLLERVKNDSLIMCIILSYLIIDNVISYPGDPMIPATTGQLATMKFSHDYIKEHNITSEEDKNPKIFWNKFIFEIDNETKNKVNNDFVGWRHGGFCSLNEDYQNIIVEEEKGFTNKSYDVTSLYPSVCVYNELPYGNYRKIKKLPKDYENYFIFVSFECEEVEQLITNCCDMIPIYVNPNATKLQKEVEYKGLHYVRKISGNLKFYDILKTCKDVWWNENFFKITGLKNIEYYLFKKKPYLKDFMNKYYQDKLNADLNHNDIQKLAAKLILNSLTGKFGQKELQETFIDVFNIANATSDVEEFLKVCEELNIKATKNTTKEKLIEKYNNTSKEDTERLTFEKVKDVAHGYLPCYCAITLLGRYKTMFTQLDHCYNNKNDIIIYSDTDSMKGRFKHGIKEELITTSKELGKWTEEFKGKAKYLKVIRPKVWGCGDINNKIITVASGGINPEKLKQYLDYDFNKFTEEATIPATQIIRCIGGKIIIDINKKIKDTK